MTHRHERSNQRTAFSRYYAELLKQIHYYFRQVYTCTRWQAMYSHLSRKIPLLYLVFIESIIWFVASLITWLMVSSVWDLGDSVNWLEMQNWRKMIIRFDFLSIGGYCSCFHSNRKCTVKSMIVISGNGLLKISQSSILIANTADISPARVKDRGKFYQAQSHIFVYLCVLFQLIY